MRVYLSSKNAKVVADHDDVVLNKNALTTHGTGRTLNEVPKSKKTLCEVCQKRSATGVIISGDNGKRSNLCDECFEATSSAEIVQSVADLLSARCQYCGGKACSGDVDYLALAEGIQRTWYLCESCSREHVRYLKRHSRSNRSLRALNDAADAHMKQWVSKKV